MENIREYEERLEKRRKRYNPRGGAIFADDESYEQKNFWDF